MAEPTKDIDDLSKPFHPALINWRVGATKNGRGMLLAYLDARAVMNRLDGVMGPENWSDGYTETASGRVFCSLGINVDDVWIIKSDGAGNTGTEGEKGAISDAFKRAAVKWGIGRYLYNIDSPWIELEQGKYIPKSFNGAQYLPEWKK